jgi:hypothetical protein
MLKVSTTDIENAIQSDVAPRWKRYTSLEGSQVDKSLSFELGLTLTTPISLLRPMQCEGVAALSFMNSVRAETYKRLSISNYIQRYLVILAPEAGCIWVGRALTGTLNPGGGVLTLQNTASAFVIAHELGHTLGLGHSNFLRCDSGKSDGPWGSDCKALEYGGSVDVMGNVDVDAPLSVYHQWRLGYLETSEVKQSWLSESIELSASDVAGPTRAIFLRDGSSSYWIEYRRASFATGFKAGLVIYRSDPPPSSAIISPNPEDASAPDPSMAVTTDYWMLNWNDYRYVRSQATGSMVLPTGSIATTFSGAVSISATPTSRDTAVTVTLNRRADVIAPPAPEIIAPSLWRSQKTSIIADGYDDAESAIARFDLQINGEITTVQARDKDNVPPTYLNPFSQAKTLYVSDLPEGAYSLTIRGVDIWGNKGPWSPKVQALIDRGSPEITQNFEISSITSESATLVWKGVQDRGSGLCTTTLSNDLGLVLARSSEKASPALTIAEGQQLSFKARVFDCLGNGMAGDVALNADFIEPVRASRTGKWIAAPTSYPKGTLKCVGRCSLSISAQGNFSALIAEGSVEISARSTPTQRTAQSSRRVLQLSPVMNLGRQKKVVRITGQNFIYGGAATLESSASVFLSTTRLAQPSDPSLLDSDQKFLATMGFNQEDFTDEWSVLPMARGTTLLDPTLDLCGAEFTSDVGRQIRRQVTASRTDSAYTFISTEVVKYRNSEAALAALNELSSVLTKCKAAAGGFVNSVFTAYSFDPVPISITPFIFTDANVIVSATLTTGAKTQQLLAFYQFQGQYFTGMYLIKEGSIKLNKSELSSWSALASEMGQRLRTNAR